MEVLIRLKSINATAKHLGLDRKTVRTMRNRVRQAAAAQGHLPELGIESGFPEAGQVVHGYSRYQQLPDGGVWIKTQTDKQKYIELMREVANELSKEIKPAKRIPRKTKKVDKDLLNLYVLSDLHIGALSWKDETGTDWDTDISEKASYAALDYLLNATEPAHTGLFCQLGDGLHYDSLRAVTPASGHVVDTDSRYHRVVRCAIRIFNTWISSMLEKYQEVIVIMAQGNHDEQSSVWLQEMMADKYSKNPRVHVIVEPCPYYSYIHGRTFLGFHHGHKKKFKELEKVFSGSKYWKQLGNCRQAYIHSGHEHHHELIETNFGVTEMHPTIAGKSSYESSGGYDSDRKMHAITYHKKGIEKSRASFYVGIDD